MAGLEGRRPASFEAPPAQEAGLAPQDDGALARRRGPRQQSSSKQRNSMARVPLIQEQDHPELAEEIARYSSGRRGKLINIYRMLLNSPALAESWFNHSNAVRWKTKLDGRLREIVIIRMGHLTNSQYVLRQHVPSLALADGLTLEECDALADWRNSKFFDDRERAALAY